MEYFVFPFNFEELTQEPSDNRYQVRILNVNGRLNPQTTLKAWRNVV